MHDVRGIANLVLNMADERGLSITNMALNKIVYFVHCDHLVERGEALVGAKIEAWQHGPVFREIYHAFKPWGDEPIRGRASKVDASSGEVIEASADIGSDESEYIKTLIGRYISFSAPQLRAMSHRINGPWHKVWGHDGRSNPGMKITTELILEHYTSGARQ